MDNQYQHILNEKFTDTRNHIISTSTNIKCLHIPCPGLVICLDPGLQLQKLFPGWEIVYITDVENVDHMNQDLKKIMNSNAQAWSNFDPAPPVGILNIDSKNVIVDCENDIVLNALHRHGITPHVANLVARHFANMHFNIVDLWRQGTMQDYFPERTS